MFVFFGLVAVLGTTYVQAERVTAAAVVGRRSAAAALACAILVANNLRDIPTDSGRPASARWPCVLGDRRTRLLYVGAGRGRVPRRGRPGRRRRRGRCSPWPRSRSPPARPGRSLPARRGRDLVPALRDTGRLELAYAVLLAVGLALA